LWTKRFCRKFCDKDYAKNFGTTQNSVKPRKIKDINFLERKSRKKRKKIRRLLLSSGYDMRELIGASAAFKVVPLV
jgi:hypothetical protein